MKIISLEFNQQLFAFVFKKTLEEGADPVSVEKQGFLILLVLWFGLMEVVSQHFVAGLPYTNVLCDCSWHLSPHIREIDVSVSLVVELTPCATTLAPCGFASRVWEAHVCGFDPVDSGKQEWLLLSRAAVAGWLAGAGECHSIVSHVALLLPVC